MYRVAEWYARRACWNGILYGHATLYLRSMSRRFVCVQKQKISCNSARGGDNLSQSLWASISPNIGWSFAHAVVHPQQHCQPISWSGLPSSPATYVSRLYVFVPPRPFTGHEQPAQQPCRKLYSLHHTRLTIHYCTTSMSLAPFGSSSYIPIFCDAIGFSLF